MECYCNLRNVQERLADGSTGQHSKRDLGRTLTDPVWMIGDHRQGQVKDPPDWKRFSGFVLRAGGRWVVRRLAARAL